MPIVTAGVTAIELIARNRMRKSLVFKNEDATINVFIKQERAITPTVSSTDHDFKLGPAESLALLENEDGKEAIQDRWTVVAASGAPIVSLYETEDVVR